MAAWEEPGRRDGEFQLLLTTAKSGYYTHSSLRNVPSLRRRAPDPSIDLSPALARARGIVEGDWCQIRTTAGSVRMRARIAPDLQDDVVIAEFGWWQGSDACAREDMPLWGPTCSSINAILGTGRRDPVSGVPSARYAWCDVRRDPAASDGNWGGKRAFVVSSSWPQQGAGTRSS